MIRSIATPVLAVTGALALATGAPASAAPSFHATAAISPYSTLMTDGDVLEYSRDRRWRDNRYRGNYYGGRQYGEPVYRNTRVWRDRDGRSYCRKRDGTTGLIIGGAAGALLGRELDGGRDRALGTILGAAGGALLGREVDRGGSRCR